HATPVPSSPVRRRPRCVTPSPPASTPPAPASGVGLAFLLLLVPAALLAVVLGIGAVVGAYFFVRSRPAEQPPVVNSDADREAELAQKQRDLDAKKKELDEQKRRQDYERLMAAGEKRLTDKNYAGAVTAFEDALKLYPNDSKALDGLVAAKAGQLPGQPVDTKPVEDPDKNKAYDKVMAEGRQAMAAKQYALACTLFESAAKLKPGDDGATNALIEAKKELDKDAA